MNHRYYYMIDLTVGISEIVVAFQQSSRLLNVVYYDHNDNNC